MGATLFSISRSSNKKTGDIPQVAIVDAALLAEGRAIDAAAETCRGCPRFPASRGGRRQPGSGACYAFRGTSGIALAAAVKRWLRLGPVDYPGGAGLDGLRRALKASARSAAAVRFGMIGDPSAASAEFRAAADICREAGFTALAYTHFWRQHLELKRYALASCESTADAEEAAAAGWRVALVQREPEAGTRIGGRAAVLCPAQREPVRGKPTVTCATCRLCDAGAERGPHIMFREH